MKKGIHPDYKQIKVTCSCGAVFQIGSTSTKDLSIEICSECHPFFTGKQKLVDAAGRLHRYQDRMEKFEAMKKQASRLKKEKNEEIEIKAVGKEKAEKVTPKVKETASKVKKAPAKKVKEASAKAKKSSTNSKAKISKKK